MKWKNGLLLLLTATIWGIAFVAQSVGMEYIGPFTFNAVRCTIGGVVLIPVIFFSDWLEKKDEQKLEKKDEKKKEGQAAAGQETGMQRKEQKTLLAGGLSCGILFCLASNFQQIGIMYTSVGKAGFITACYIVIVPLLGIFFKKACSPAVWGAVVLALIGLYLLCMEKGGFSISRGDFLVFICAVLFSLHILAIDHFSPLVNGVKLSCIQFFVCGILSAAAMLITEKPVLSEIFAAWMPILYAGVMSCGVAYTLQILGQRGMNPTLSSLILSLESSISVLAGWLILGQKLSGRQLLGCAVMFGAILLAQLPASVMPWRYLAKDFD